MLRGVTGRHRKRLTSQEFHRTRLEAGKSSAAARWGNHDPGPAAQPGPSTAGPSGKARRVEPISLDGVPATMLPGYEIRNQAGEPPSLYIHGEIGGWGLNVEYLISEIIDLDADHLVVHLNSPGGSVFDGTALFNTLIEHPAVIDVRIDGAALSIASVIAQAGDKVTMARNASMMIHDAWMGTEGDEQTHLDSAVILSKLSDQIADVYAVRSGKGTKKTWREAMRNETWFNADEALEAGLVDEVAKLGRREGGTDQWSTHTNRYRYGGRDDAPAPIIPEPRSTARTRLTIDQAASNPAAEHTTVEVLDKACPVHHTQTSDSPWDAGSHIGRLDSPLTVATAERVYGWYDSDAVEDGEMPKSACKLPHHEVQADGRPGPANLAGVRNALSRLPQSDIPESDHAAIQRHLQAHLDDAPEEEDSAGLDDGDVEVLETIPFDFAGALRAAVDQADVPNIDWDPGFLRTAVEAAAENVPAFPDRKPDPDDGDDDLEAVAASIASLFAPPEQAEPFTEGYDPRRVRAAAEAAAAQPAAVPAPPSGPEPVSDELAGDVRDMADKLTGPKTEQAEPLANDWDVRRIRAAIEAAGALALPVVDHEAEDRIPDEVIAAAAEAYAALAAGKPKAPAAPIGDGWDGRKIAAAIENAATVPALPDSKPVDTTTDGDLSASFVNALVRAAPTMIGET